MEGVEGNGVQNARIHVDVVDDEIEHLGRLGIRCDLGAQGGLVVGRANRTVADGSHSLQHRANLVQSITLNGSQNAEHRELIVEQGAIFLLILVVHGHGDYAEFLFHAPHHVAFQLQNTDSSHGGVPLGEHIADLELLHVLAVHLIVVRAAIRLVEQAKHLLGHAVKLSGIKNELVFAFPVLLDDIHHAGAPVGIGADVIAGDQAVDVSLLVLLAVAVILMEDRNEGDLLIQGPRAVLHGLVQVRLTYVGEQILIEQGHEGKAILGQKSRAESAELSPVKLNDLVEALGPPRLAEINIVRLPHIGKRAADALVGSHVAGGGQDVILACIGADGGSGLLYHVVGTVAGLLDADDLDSEALLHGLVALKNGVVDGLGGQSLHGNLTRRPSLTVAADNGDLVVIVIQVIGQIVGQLRGRLGSRSMGILSGGRIARIVVALAAGNEGACHHKNGQQQSREFGQLHVIILR